jgi:hypothetical protein
MKRIHINISAKFFLLIIANIFSFTNTDKPHVFNNLSDSANNSSKALVQQIEENVVMPNRVGLLKPGVSKIINNRNLYSTINPGLQSISEKIVCLGNSTDGSFNFPETGKALAGEIILNKIRKGLWQTLSKNRFWIPQYSVQKPNCLNRFTDITLFVAQQTVDRTKSANT